MVSWFDGLVVYVMVLVEPGVEGYGKIGTEV